MRVINRLVGLRRRSDSRQSLRGLPARYSVQCELGRGGMAVVYLARDRQLGRDVAIKVLHSTLSADKSSVARLTHEAHLVAQLQHPHIVAIHDLERLRDQSVALVMQFVRGRTLRSMIDDGEPLSIPFVERVLSEIASALGAAHRRGIIHRDVKPENIYLDEESGRALLADFGIAHAPRLEAGLTLAGEAIGTPNYMSPEQVSGDPLDGRSDLYSLGLVGYEMLTGERPWNGETLYSVLHKQQHEYLPSLRERRKQVPTALRLALERALRKDRADRPASAEDLLAILTGSDAVEEAEPQPYDVGFRDESEVDDYSADAPTVRYKRSAVESRGSAGPSPAETPPAEPEVRPDADARPPAATIPFWLLDSADEDATEPPDRGVPAPVEAVAHAEPVTEPVHFETIRSVPTATETVADQRPGYGDLPVWRDLRSNRRRNSLAIAAGVAAVAFVIVLVGLFALSGGSGARVMASPPQDSTAVQAAREEPASPPEASSAPAPAPVPSRGGRSASSVARENYDPSGDVTDIFCRPHGEETVEAWLDRVPSYCAPRVR